MRIAVAAGKTFLRALGCTWRLEWHGVERLETARRHSPSHNVIYAFWHSSLAILAYTHRQRDIQVLVSQHHDGEVIARILEGLGYGLVRGSSRRGGAEALFGLAKQLEAGLDVAVTVDGPVGPRYHVRSGVLLLARRTGRPIVPVIPTARRCTYLGTWDALRLPNPGAVVRIQHGEPVWLARGLREEQLRRQRRELEETLRESTLREEALHGRRLELDDVQDCRSWLERASERAHPPVPLRSLALLHGAGRRLERALRPRPRGHGSRPWVVGIGNLEAGGTGKTPCVLALASELQAAGLQIAILTRGHRGQLGARQPVIVRDAAHPGAADETRLLAAALGPTVPITVSRDKRRGLELLRLRPSLDVVLVDDALQTPGLAVDRHLVLLDWAHPLGNGYLLPAGRLREGADALRHAHAVLFTRARGDGMPRHPAWGHLEPEGCFLARERAVGRRRPDGTRFDPAALRGRGVALLSGLGRPQAFESTARGFASRHGFEVRRAVRVSDHADIESPLRRLLRKLHGIECDFVILSRKDHLRLPPQSKWNEPLLVLEQRLELDSPAELLRILVPHSWSSKSAKFTDSEA